MLRPTQYAYPTQYVAPDANAQNWSNMFSQRNAAIDAKNNPTAPGTPTSPTAPTSPVGVGVMPGMNQQGSGVPSYDIYNWWNNLGGYTQSPPGSSGGQTGTQPINSQLPTSIVSPTTPSSPIQNPPYNGRTVPMWDPTFNGAYSGVAARQGYEDWINSGMSIQDWLNSQPNP